MSTASTDEQRSALADASGAAAGDAPAIRLTAGALERILELRAAETDGESLGLRIEVTGSNGADYTYDLSFEPVAEVPEGHRVDSQDGLSVIIPADSVDRLVGSTLDLPANPAQGGLVLRNPNR